MKKTITYGTSFILSILIFFLIPQLVKADIVPLIKGTTPEIATENGKLLQDAINQTSISKAKQVTLPAGLFYINGKIILKSHIILTGPTASPTATTLTMNNAPMTTDSTPTSQESVTDITLQNFSLQYNPNISKFNYLTNPTNFYQDNLLNIGMATKAETSAGYKAITKKALKTNIKITNMIFNANNVGSSIINVAKAKNIIIQNNLILNSGLQNGISLTYTDNITIIKNRIKNLGRTGIFAYYGNSNINITNNQVIDWMQRYGSYHYDAVKKSGQTLDSMQDSAIDSYGPMNQYITVRNNQINLSASANKVNPNNPLIAKKWRLKTVPRYARYTAIRASGAQYVLYQGNTINIDSPDTFAFFTTNMRKSNTLTRPKAITLIGNTFTSRNIDYPVRIFAGISDPPNLNGITIQSNSFRIIGKINNYYRSLINVREVPITENRRTTYYPTALLSVFNNKIRTTNLGSVVDGASTSRKDALQLLFLNNNTNNGRLYQVAKNNIGTTLKSITYSKNALKGTIIWNADETKTKYIRITNLAGKAITTEQKLNKSSARNFSIPIKLVRGTPIKLQITEAKGNYRVNTTIIYQVK
ncbi:right-handed parallel beta-helix repeat-containing protein [Listeria rocourtiae]|uniref:right-handed parallel beta-helix repeat-containing protein n=1 Tax=Listeria rocourtiae TaxID=647910 RepID=UPI0016261058|nr:right-handed parallel beta-helix repeat-containing protein [Listeria rocourtiae]MBC1433942.1 right-handed parallel beta-helix repeat-containing protein [Listeria rocourtiae]